MRENTGTVAVGVFEDRSDAQAAVHELRRQGFEEDHIGVAAKHDEDLPEGAEHHDEKSKAGKGAGIGAATGLGVGGLWGLGIVAGALPGIGTAIAGGALAGILSSAAAGAAAGGLLGALAGLGMSEDEAEYYEGELKQGRILVTVRPEGRYEEAQSILRQFGAYDIHSERDGRSRTETTRSETIRTPPSMEREVRPRTREQDRTPRDL